MSERVTERVARIARLWSGMQDAPKGLRVRLPPRPQNGSSLQTSHSRRKRGKLKRRRAHERRLRTVTLRSTTVLAKRAGIELPSMTDLHKHG